MKAIKRKVSDLTVDEFKSVIHEVITEDMESWRETLEIMADRKLMKQIRFIKISEIFLPMLLIFQL